MQKVIGHVASGVWREVVELQLMTCCMQRAVQVAIAVHAMPACLLFHNHSAMLYGLSSSHAFALVTGERFANTLVM